MHFTTAALTATLLGLASAQKVHVVSVGVPNSKETAFKPNNIKAAKGEMIQFQFRGGNHSVVQSDFDNPCVPVSQTAGSPGIFSGYQPVDASAAQNMIPTWTVMVNNTDPMWLYCSASTHCQGGMVMVVNENPALNQSRTLEAYKSLAASAPENIGGDGVISGTIAGGAGAGAGESDSDPSQTPGASGPTGTGVEEPAVTPSAGNKMSWSSSSGWVGLAGLAAAVLFVL